LKTNANLACAIAHKVDGICCLLVVEAEKQTMSLVRKRKNTIKKKRKERKRKENICAMRQIRSMLRKKKTFFFFFFFHFFFFFFSVCLALVLMQKVATAMLAMFRQRALLSPAHRLAAQATGLRFVDGATRAPPLCA
jgi:hypothetical protein